MKDLLNKIHKKEQPLEQPDNKVLEQESDNDSESDDEDDDGESES